MDDVGVRPLPRRPLGRTGRSTTAIGLGLAALGRPGYLTLGRDDDLGPDRSVEAMRRRTWEVLDEARRLGIGHVDVARSYGRAEELLAGWLVDRQVAPDELTVSTKWGYTYVGGWRVDVEVHEVKDHSLATLRRQLPETLELLGPWLDVEQIHSATLDTGVLDDDAVLDALAAVRDEGRVVGLSTSGPGQGDVVRRALEVERGGRPLFGTVQSTWNVLEPSVGPALADAHDAGLGVIVKEAVANGRLTPHGALAPEQRSLLAAAVDGAPPVDQIALAAALAQPWADVVLSGAVTVDQLASNAAAVDLVDRVDVDALDRLAEPAGTYWATRAAQPWT